jgi:hypothetical protein
MDSILVPIADGTFQRVYGCVVAGLFLQRLENGRFLARHAASGLSLFHFLGPDTAARRLQLDLAGRYDFERDSTWVMKGQSEIHSILVETGLERRWLYRSWHYSYSPESTALRPSTLEV